MPTLDDLREAFAELERQAPDALSRPLRPSPRRHWAAIGLTAACTAALAVTIPLALGGGGGAGQPTHLHRYASVSPVPVPAVTAPGFTSALPAPAAGHSPDLVYKFRVAGTIGGYNVVVDEISRTYQHGLAFGPLRRTGDVFAFYRGAFDPGTLTNRSRVDVAGRPGYFASVQLPGHSHPVRALAWQYADAGWAVVWLPIAPVTAPAHGDRRAELRARAQQAAENAEAAATEVHLAAAMQRANDPVRSPVALPGAGGSDTYVTRITGAAIGSLDLASAGDTTWHLEWSATPLQPHGKRIRHIAGRRWVDLGRGSLGLLAGHFGLIVTLHTTMGIPDVTQFVNDFVRNVHLAPDLTDQSTWFDANTALP